MLEEGSFYLSVLGVDPAQIAVHFETTEGRVKKLIAAYRSKLESGRVTQQDFDRTFWEDVKKEAEGDVKLTFVSDRGFHHSWKSELAKLDGPSLMAVYESSRDILNSDPNQRYHDVPPPKGFDPLALEREVRKAVSVISELLDVKWKEQKAKSSGE